MSRCSRLLRTLALFAALAGATTLAWATPIATVTAPTSALGGQAGYAASVPTQGGATYAWTIANGTITLGAASDSIAFVAGSSGSVTLTCRVTDATGAAATGSATVPITAATPPRFNLEQALSDRAQMTTIAFGGLGLLTGNLEAQSFFPPGKVADYWGFQSLRDNDPDDMGHNTSFLTRAACNALVLLSDEQFSWLKTLASSQVAAINLYAFERYPLMTAFRRLVDGDLPAGATGLDVGAVKAASRELYRLDGQISYERAVVYARIFRTLTAEQKRALGAMAGKGWASWPDKTMDDVRERMRGLSHDESVAVMTYAGDLFSWYVGSLTSDVYFCPERHGTYFGSFYMKDAPAMGHEGYSIDETLTGTAGAALCDATKGYVSSDQAAIVATLVDTQRSNLSTGSANIVAVRTAVARALRSLIGSTEPSAATLDAVRNEVLTQSALYGELDGENVAAYAIAFARLEATLTDAQRSHLLELRRSFMAGTYADGTPFDFTVCDTYFLFAAEVTDLGTLATYLADSDRFFTFTGAPTASFSLSPTSPLAGAAAQLTDTSTGSPTAWSWSFGDGATSSAQNPTHAWSTAGSYPVTLTASNASGSSTASHTVEVRTAGSSVCAPSSTSLCLDGSTPGDRRFRLEIAYTTAQGGGRSGSATAVSTAPLGFDAGGIFWFFDASNPEMLVKVLDGCGVNGKYWVYASAGTNVGFTLTVVDTQSGQAKTYSNADLHPAAAIQDTAAFPCP